VRGTAPGHQPDEDGAMFEKMTGFIREAVAELKRVTWPTRKEIGGSTLVVLIVVSILMLCIGFFDFLLSILVKLIVR
jgi:preprotein translocase subunit SecE